MVQGRLLGAAAIAAILTGLSVAQAQPSIEAVPGEFLVRVKNLQTMRTKSALLAFGAEKVRTVSKEQGIILVKRNMLEQQEHAVAVLSSVNNVELVEPNYIYRISRLPNDPKLEDLWGLRNAAQKGGRAGIDIGAEHAWDIQTGSQNVLVAVIDTGVDYTHPDLAANAWTNAAEANGQAGVDDDGNGYIDDIHGYDFANNDGDPIDDHGHGTHCAGTIGASGNDGKGIVGVAWNVRIMGIKFLTASGSGTLENAIKSIDYATAMGAQIQSNSWGGGGYTELLEQAIKRANEKNVVFVAAAGNDSNNNDVNPSYPATYNIPNIISVAAVDNAGMLAYFSSYGKTKVHVAAPGVAVTSSVPFSVNPSGYETMSGTSMATPHVSGISALILSQYPGIRANEVRELLVASSRTLGSLRNKVASAGIANAYYALSGVTPPADTEDPFNWSAMDYAKSSIHPYKENTVEEFTVSVDGASQISIYFERFDTERGYDTVEFIDASGVVVAKWSGNHDGEFSPPVKGSSMRVRFKADHTVNGYGFDISKLAYK